MSEVLGAKALVDAAMAAAMVRVLPRDLAAEDPLIRRSDRADFQSNAALGLAKKAGLAPRDLAESLFAALDNADFEVELSGPGFLNFTLADPALWRLLAARLADERMGVAEPVDGVRTLVDYSGPNIAKQLHVGHIRSTVIGDALVRILTYLGADVTRANHLGDWGTSFGKLIQYLDEHAEPDLDGSVDLDTLDVLYYVFDPDRMVSLTGNTSVYLQYAHARACSVLGKLPAELSAATVDPSVPIHRAERALILALDEFGAVLAEVAESLEPHRLCTYLFESAKAFSDFWQNCPVIKADDAAQRGNRVALVRLTGRTLARGLDLLGIEAPRRL